MDTAIGSTALINTQGDFNECDSFQSEIGQREAPEFS
jgi:hypothetical protein